MSGLLFILNITNANKQIEDTYQKYKEAQSIKK